MQKNMLETDRTYSLKKADVDGVSKSAFDLFRSDSARLLTRACISLKIVKILLNEIDVLGTR